MVTRGTVLIAALHIAGVRSHKLCFRRLMSTGPSSGGTGKDTLQTATEELFTHSYPGIFFIIFIHYC